jgi:hypothetical protein
MTVSFSKCFLVEMVCVMLYMHALCLGVFGGRGRGMPGVGMPGVGRGQQQEKKPASGKPQGVKNQH